MVKNFTLPYRFNPRSYQKPLMKAMDSGRTGSDPRDFRYSYIVWHRRAGKEKTCLNFLAKEMWLRKGNYYYLFPTYKQGKKVLWEGIDKDQFKLLDHIPKQIRTRVDNSDMSIELINGSIFRVVGTDDIDTIMGVNPVGCVFSEYALQDPQAWDFIAPIIAENGGWVIFNTTPRGENHAFDLWKYAKNSPEWFTQILTADDTGSVPKDILAEEKRRYRQKYGDDSFFNQEYYCSFQSPVMGSYYGPLINMADEEGRITRVAFDRALTVDTYWDLGMNDTTNIWFVQQHQNEIRVIDCYENQGEGLAHYASILRERHNSQGYEYGEHCFPHDVKVRDMGTGKSRIDTLYSLGVKPKVLSKLPREDGIEAVRNIMYRCWFDKDKCAKGISALKNYRKDYDAKNEVYKSTPVHDKASHFADAFRMLGIGVRSKMEKKVKRARHDKVKRARKILSNPLGGR